MEEHELIRPVRVKSSSIFGDSKTSSGEDLLGCCRGGRDGQVLCGKLRQVGKIILMQPPPFQRTPEFTSNTISHLCTTHHLIPIQLGTNKSCCYIMSLVDWPMTSSIYHVHGFVGIIQLMQIIIIKLLKIIIIKLLLVSIYIIQFLKKIIDILSVSGCYSISVVVLNSCRCIGNNSCSYYSSWSWRAQLKC